MYDAGRNAASMEKSAKNVTFSGLQIKSKCFWNHHIYNTAVSHKRLLDLSESLKSLNQASNSPSSQKCLQLRLKSTPVSSLPNAESTPSSFVFSGRANSTSCDKVFPTAVSFDCAAEHIK